MAKAVALEMRDVLYFLPTSLERRLEPFDLALLFYRLRRSTICGGRTPKRANMLVILLRSGALPAWLTVVTERAR